MANAKLGVSGKGFILQDEAGADAVTVAAAGVTLVPPVTAPRFISTQATGTAPLTVASTTLVANLNADQLDGFEGSAFPRLAAANTFTENQTIQKNQNASTQLAFLNNDAGTSARARFIIGADTSAANGMLEHFGSGFTAAGAFIASRTSLRGRAAGGLAMVAENAAGVFEVYTGGSAAGNLRLQISAAGGIGLYGVTPVARAAALVQTYSTADRTHAARTAAALTDNTAGVVSTTLAALPNPADAPATADALRDDLVANLIPVIRNALASLSDQVNKLRNDQLDTAQFLNALVDDTQALGINQ